MVRSGSEVVDTPSGQRVADAAVHALGGERLGAVGQGLDGGVDSMVVVDFGPALLSRSADAEFNARIVEKFGHETVRGSGGRNEGNDSGKGGARALIALKRELDQGKSTAMIADISKSTARQAGMGVILLARLSGRPIVAVAYATSRRRILKKSWDQTVISLPFGRAAVISGEPLFVEKDADDARMEAYRVELTNRLNAATDAAYRLADQRP